MKPMKVIWIVFWATIFGRCFSPVFVMGNDVEVFSRSKAEKSDSIVAPNVFSPNSKINANYFEVKSSDDQPVILKIFTRAGVLVFSIEAKLCIWDGCSLSGQPMASGVYFYTAEVRNSSPKISKSGFLHLFR